MEDLKSPHIIFRDLPQSRKRQIFPKHIKTKVIEELDKLNSIPLKTQEWKNIYWKDTPTGIPLTIDLPRMDMAYKCDIGDFHKDVIYYDEERIKNENIQIINESCVVTHKGEIVCLYINEKTDEAITKATEKLRQLGKQMETHYPVKKNTFYSGFRLGAKTPEAKQKAHEYKQSRMAIPRYKGKNYLDGMICYFRSPHPNTPRGYGHTIAFQPRMESADTDEDFLFNYAYSSCALYALEKRYAPNVAKYRLDLATSNGFVGIIPPLPLELNPSTGFGGSVDFASSIHNDSGLKGLTETIIWTTPPDKTKKQYFVVPEFKVAFDLHTHNAIILQPPKIAHGTCYTGNHGGYGFVNITKGTILRKVEPTDIKKNWYEVWKHHFEI